MGSLSPGSIRSILVFLVAKSSTISVGTFAVMDHVAQTPSITTDGKLFAPSIMRTMSQCSVFLSIGSGGCIHFATCAASSGGGLRLRRDLMKAVTVISRERRWRVTGVEGTPGVDIFQWSKVLRRISEDSHELDRLRSKAQIPQLMDIKGRRTTLLERAILLLNSTGMSHKTTQDLSIIKWLRLRLIARSSVVAIHDRMHSLTGWRYWGLEVMAKHVIIKRGSQHPDLTCRQAFGTRPLKHSHPHSAERKSNEESLESVEVEGGLPKPKETLAL